MRVKSDVFFKRYYKMSFDEAPLPPHVVSELPMMAALSPFMIGDPSRQRRPLLLASDASREPAGGGFGVSLARPSAETVADFGRLAERRGDYVRVQGEE